jgi:hypothetical protein
MEAYGQIHFWRGLVMTERFGRCYANSNALRNLALPVETSFTVGYSLVRRGQDMTDLALVFYFYFAIMQLSNWQLAPLSP